MPLHTVRDKTAHLLRRAGLGASKAELDYYTPLGINTAVDVLLDYHKVDEGLDVDFWQLQDERVKIPAKLAAAWWAYRMLVTRRPAQEKLVLFWHNHFGCSLEKVKASMLMYQHLNTLRRNATGNFRTLLVAVAQDPTMLVFLDGKDNVSGHPNENFARELMELFTLGEGHYSEKDVQEAARAFTGWSIQRNGKVIDATSDEMLPSYRFRPMLHDDGQKTLLGTTGNLDGTDVIDILLRQPQHARFLCKKLWEWYAYPEPEEAVLQRLAATYVGSGYEIKPVLQAIFTSEEFYSDKAARALYKSPVDFAVAIMRQLKAPELVALARQYGQDQGGEAGARLRLISPIAGYTYKAMESMGMQLMFPPSVAGWDGGAAWVNSATMLQRIKFADLFDPDAPQRRNLRWQLVFGASQVANADDAVEYCCTLFDAPLTAQQRGTIAQSAQAAAVWGISMVKLPRLPVAVIVVLVLLPSVGCNKPGGGSVLGGFLGNRSAPPPLATADLAPAAVGTGFVKVDPAQSGIDFINEASDVQLVARTYTLASGLASGDYDGDGDFDLYFCGLNSKNRLYRNDGGWKFTNVTEEAGTGLDGGDSLSIAAAFVDLTGDGKADLYVTNRDGGNLFFQGDGKGHFTDETESSGLKGSFPSTSPAFLDANNDGNLDVFVANYYPRRPPMGTFVQEYMQAHSGSLDGPTLGKLLNLAMLNAQRKVTEADFPEPLSDKIYRTAYGQVFALPPPQQLFMGDGKGHFTDGTQAAGLNVSSWGLAAQACDFNDDGYTDLYVSSDFEVPDRYFINNKDGTFTDQAGKMLRKTPWYSMGVDSGDINNDGLPDLMTSDMLSKDYKRAKRQSGDMWNGRMEMLYDNPQPQMRNMLFVNRGGGWMTEMGQMAGVAASEWTWSVRIADLDSSGRNDIYASNGMLYDVMDVDFSAARDQANASADPVTQVVNLIREQPGYLSDDYIFSQDEPYKFKQAPENWGLKDGAMSCGASLADYDGDGDLDLITNNTNSKAGLWRNDVPQGAQVLVDLKQPGSNPYAIGSRVWLYCGDQVYTDDVIVSRGYATGEAGQLHFGLGDKATIDRLVVRWPDRTVQEYSALAVNKHYSVPKGSNLPQWQPDEVKPLFTQAELPFKQVELDTQDEEFKAEPLLPLQASIYGTGAGVADYNQDGNPDVYFAGSAGMAGQLYRGDGHGGLTVDSAFKGAFPPEAEEMAVLWFDADGDGRSDLLVTAGGIEAEPGSDNYGARLYLNTSSGFLLHTLPQRNLSTGAAAAADVDGDGDMDLFLAGHVQRFGYLKTVPSALYLNDGKGNFTDQTVKFVQAVNQGPPITDAQFADVTGDDKADLLLARFFGKVELWTGSGTGFTHAGDLTDTGWWRSLGVGDFDNDGDLDVLAGNLGQDTKYAPHPDKGQPVTLFANDFDHNGSRDLIEVKFAKIDGKDCALPGRGRSCSGYAISYIPQKWPTWASFANATLDDVYGGGLKTAEKYEANTMASCVCLNDGAGKFTAADLHGAAQWAPAFGIAVADYDCDGNLDAFVGNNFDKPQPETGNWQTSYGVLLKGDGKGGFTEVPQQQLGLYLPQDNRAVLSTDMNGDGSPDILVSLSDGAAQLGLRTADEMAGKAVWITLRGKVPNTAGVGAKVKLVLSNNSALTREVQAGCGYLGSVNGPIHFGVPKGVTATKVEVDWTDGTHSSMDVTSDKFEVKQ